MILANYRAGAGAGERGPAVIISALLLDLIPQQMIHSAPAGLRMGRLPPSAPFNSGLESRFTEFGIPS